MKYAEVAMAKGKEAGADTSDTEQLIEKIQAL